MPRFSAGRADADVCGLGITCPHLPPWDVQSEPAGCPPPDCRPPSRSFPARTPSPCPASRPYPRLRPLQLPRRTPPSHSPSGCPHQPHRSDQSAQSEHAAAEHRARAHAATIAALEGTASPAPTAAPDTHPPALPQQSHHSTAPAKAPAQAPEAHPVRYDIDGALEPYEYEPAPDFGLDWAADLRRASLASRRSSLATSGRRSSRQPRWWNQWWTATDSYQPPQDTSRPPHPGSQLHDLDARSPAPQAPESVPVTGPAAPLAPDPELEGELELELEDEPELHSLVHETLLRSPTSHERMEAMYRSVDQGQSRVKGASLRSTDYSYSADYLRSPHPRDTHDAHDAGSNSSTCASTSTSSSTSCTSALATTGTTGTSTTALSAGGLRRLRLVDRASALKRRRSLGWAVHASTSSLSPSPEPSAHTLASWGGDGHTHLSWTSASTSPGVADSGASRRGTGLAYVSSSSGSAAPAPGTRDPRRARSFPAHTAAAGASGRCHGGSDESDSGPQAARPLRPRPVSLLAHTPRSRSLSSRPDTQDLTPTAATMHSALRPVNHASAPAPAHAPQQAPTSPEEAPPVAVAVAVAEPPLPPLAEAEDDAEGSSTAPSLPALGGTPTPIIAPDHTHERRRRQHQNQLQHELGPEGEAEPELEPQHLSPAQIPWSPLLRAPHPTLSLGIWSAWALQDYGSFASRTPSSSSSSSSPSSISSAADGASHTGPVGPDPDALLVRRSFDSRLQGKWTALRRAANVGGTLALAASSSAALAALMATLP